MAMTEPEFRTPASAMQRGVSIECTIEMLSEVLNLPKGYQLRAIDSSGYNNGAKLIIVGPDLPEVEPGFMFPIGTANIRRHEDGHTSFETIKALEKGAGR